MPINICLRTALNFSWPYVFGRRFKLYSADAMATGIPNSVDWPLWTKLGLVKPSVLLPVPLYFFWALLQQCAKDREIARFERID